MKQFLGKIWKAACLSGLAILWILTFIFPTFSKAFVASDMGDGVIELTTRTDEGFVIKSLTRLTSEKDKKKMIYFCVSQTTGNAERCFYGLDREFRNLKEGDKLLGLQYGLSERIHNNKKQIPIGEGRYFYQIHVVRPGA